MPWVEKTATTPFDAQTIPGLFYLDGDRFAEKHHCTATRNRKHPMIAFPSGQECGLYENSHLQNGPVVHLFGEMDLPLHASAADAQAQAEMLAAINGYQVTQVEPNTLDIQGTTPEQRYRVLYDEAGTLADVQQLPPRLAEQAARSQQDLLQQWRALPEAEQATLAYLILSEVLSGTYGNALAQLLPVMAAAQRLKAGETMQMPTVAATNGHELLDEAIRERLPLVYTPEGEGDHALAQARFYLPGSLRTWYPSAYDGKGMFFGLVVEYDLHFDYFHLSELQALQGADGQTTQRDPDFIPRTLADLKTQHEESLRQ